MKIIGVIPARKKSTRFPNKPLSKILGKPMIEWVYNNAMKSQLIDNLYVATDDDEIYNFCISKGMQVLMTSVNCKTPTERVIEISKNIISDIYVMINGDEPLVDQNSIDKLITETDSNKYQVSNLMSKFSSMTELVDVSNLKVVTNNNYEALYISRNIIPYPKANDDFAYMKFVGVSLMTKKALDFYERTNASFLENIEGNDLLRFIENNYKVKFVETSARSLSVDYPEDIKKIENIMSNFS